MQRLVNYELKIYFPAGKRMCLTARDDENGALMTKLLSSDKRAVKHGGHLYVLQILQALEILNDHHHLQETWAVTKLH